MWRLNIHTVAASLSVTEQPFRPLKINNQRRSLKHIIWFSQEGDDTKAIADLRSFLTSFLQWPKEYLAGYKENNPILELLKIPLREFGETLEPNIAFTQNTNYEDDSQLIILVKVFSIGSVLVLPLVRSI